MINSLFAYKIVNGKHITLLELYGLYKQSTVGDVNISKPSFFNFKDCVL